MSHQYDLESGPSLDQYYKYIDYPDEKPDLSVALIRKYLATRFSTLFTFHSRSLKSLNPVPPLRKLSRQDWSFYFLGWLAWSFDSMDFFCVSASLTLIAESLQVTVKDITWGVTLVLMLRSVGLVIFGYAGDRYGRKYPFIACCLCFIVLEIGSGFVNTLRQFLGVRLLFGIAMGGMYGIALATSIENVKGDLKSILSGFFLPGYNFGYLLLVVFYRAFQDTHGGEGWRSLFWFTAGLPVILIVWRLMLPESPMFVEAQQLKKLHNDALAPGEENLKMTAWTDAKAELKNYWLILVYLVFLMSGFNFMSHGSQDLYPTMLVTQKLFTADQKTVTMVVINLGAMCGGIFFGQLTEICGRRLTIVITCVMAGAFVYPSFFLATESGTIGGTFWLQFAVMGCWGIAPLHLMELCPPNYRAFTSGLVYQLGNLASSLSITIEATIGTRFPLKEIPGLYNYAKVMLIFMGCVLLYMIIITILGPERFHKDLTIIKAPGYEDKALEAGEESEEREEVDEEAYLKTRSDHIES